MTTETDLLPLPEKVEVDKHLPTGVRIYAYDATTLKNYASANVAHAAAPLQAEIERLRSILIDLKDWDCDVSGGLLSIPVWLRRRIQNALAGTALAQETTNG